MGDQGTGHVKGAGPCRIDSAVGKDGAAAGENIVKFKTSVSMAVERDGTHHGFQYDALQTKDGASQGE